METRTQTFIVVTDEERAILEAIYEEFRKKVVYPQVLISNMEAARLLGVSYATISKWLSTGRLTRRVIGESTGLLLSEVMEQKKTRRDAEEPRG